ncbi:MAG: 3-methyl-2-oxobutanoate hydroxymethyltransferase, partial [Oscillochloris sp.]|nr:3-methyl-2-oxobutanoate hydroxymethyltransferase [Oscillochloris sp.]
MQIEPVSIDDICQASLLFVREQALKNAGRFLSDGLAEAVKIEGGMPVSLHLISIPQYLDFLEDSTPYEPWKFEADYCALIADAAETHFDDHLSQIQVPVFNVAAAGGVGELSVYGTTLLGSTDVSHLIV